MTVHARERPACWCRGVEVAEHREDFVDRAASVVALKRSSRVNDFADELIATGLTADRIVDAVKQAERFGDLLLEAASTAAECPDEQRRKLLARAFAAGIEENVTIDDSQFFIRTMRQVEPIHM